MQWKLKEPTLIYVDEEDLTPELIKFRPKTREEEDEDGVPALLVPCEIVICSTCSGRGHHSLHLGVYSGERLAEARADEDFWDDYVSGRLDQTCDTCDGQGRLQTPEDSIAPELAALIKEHDDADAEEAAERRAEMRYMYGPGDY